MSIFSVKERPAARLVGFGFSVKDGYELPNVCAQAMKQLQDQPYFNGTKLKILAVKNECDAKILEIFTSNVFLQVWNVKHTDIPINNTIVLDCSSFFDQFAAICYESILESFYEDVFTRLIHDWKKVEEKDDFEVFTKKISLKNEEALISSLSSKFSLSNDVQSSVQDDHMSIRVRKSEKEKIIKKLGLQLPEK